MLTIRAAQMKALEAVRPELFEQRLLRHLAKKYSRASDAALRDLVQRGIRQADLYGFVTEHGIATFLELLVEEGENFHKDPARTLARAILTGDDDMPEAARVDALLRSRPWIAPDPTPVEDPEP